MGCFWLTSNAKMDKLIPMAQYFGGRGDTRLAAHLSHPHEWCRSGEHQANHALAVPEEAPTTLGLIYVANSELPNWPDERDGRGQIP